MPEYLPKPPIDVAVAKAVGTCEPFAGANPIEFAESLDSEPYVLVSERGKVHGGYYSGPESAIVFFNRLAAVRYAALQRQPLTPIRLVDFLETDKP